MKRKKLLLCAVVILWSIFPVSFGTGEEGRQLTTGQISEVLRHYVLAHGPWQESQLEIEVEPFSSPVLPQGAIEVQILKLNRGITPGPHRFFLGIKVGGHEEARLWIAADIRIFADVLITSQPVAHYEVLTPENIRLERRDVSRLAARAFTAFEQVEGKQAARPIEINQILTPTMIELPQVIRRGSSITLLYESAGLRVETPGRAAEPGRVGDHIHVENPSSGKVLEGEVVDARTVRVN